VSLAANLKRHIVSLTKKSRAPKSEGYYEAQEYIQTELRSMGYEPHRHEFNVFTLGQCTNIYAETAAGSTSAPSLLIGAHYDTRKSSGPAADDNTSGVAIVLELARHLKKVAQRPFVFAFFDMEEIIRFGSLRGSRAFAEFYPAKLERAVILDTVGGNLAPGFENTFLQFGLGLQTPSSQDLEFLHLPIRILEPMGKSFARSDYAAFREMQIPFSFFTSGTPWYYHTPADTLDILNWDKIEKLTHALLKTLQEAKSTQEPSIESLHRFLQLFQNVPELESPKIQAMLEKAELPSRWEIVRLYAHVLPRLRKAGPNLWR
jgi:acetylornithine deacetylase/succinyl-diaminopimelate desuccinylase-like protein